jgi:excisionase family DNA binding protein
MVNNTLKVSDTKITRLNRIIQMRKIGLTYDKIGLEFGISRERVRQLYNGKKRNNIQTDFNKLNIWLKTGDVADIVNVHVSTVRRWADQGILKSYRVGPRNDRRFRKEDVDSLFKKIDKIS